MKEKTPKENIKSISDEDFIPGMGGKLSIFHFTFFMKLLFVFSGHFTFFSHLLAKTLQDKYKIKDICGIVIGGEKQDAQTLFKNYAQMEYDQIASIGSGVRNNIVHAFSTAGVRTINEVSESNPQIGGTIRYTIIRRGFPITEGTV